MNTHNKTYILLKDYPCRSNGKFITVKVGTEITLLPNTNVYYLQKDSLAFTSTEVENNPEWFKIKEILFTTEDGVGIYNENQNVVILWDDNSTNYIAYKKLVFYKCNIKVFSSRKSAQKWIKDNKLKEDGIIYDKSYVDSLLQNIEALTIINKAAGFLKDKHAIEGEADVFGISIFYDRLKDAWYEAKKVKVNECDVIYNTFEEYYANRNNPTPATVPQKDYEILSYSNLRYAPFGGGVRIKGEDGKFRFNSHVNDSAYDEEQLQDWDIHSVKRLSDGQKFSLGFFYKGKYITGFRKAESCIIVSFDNFDAMDLNSIKLNPTSH